MPTSCRAFNFSAVDKLAKFDGNLNPVWAGTWLIIFGFTCAVVTGGVWIFKEGASGSGTRSVKFKLSPSKDILLLELIKLVISGMAS